jgi:glycosyltransferase involved in cell wall biosynthesis
MNILFLTSRFPFPPIGGDRLRTYWFIRELSKRHNIHLLSFADPDEPGCVDADIKKRIKITTVRHSHLGSCLKTGMNIFKNQPLQVSYYYYKTMQQKLDSIIKEENPDIVFVHLLRMARYVIGTQQVKKVIDLSDSFGMLYFRTYKLRKGLFKLIDYIEQKKITKLEKDCLAYFDNLIITSAADKAWIDKGANHGKIKTITNGIEPEMEGLNLIRPEPGLIGFFGNMRPFSNKYAILNFVKNIFPLIKRQIKNARLLVIGADPPRALYSSLKDKDIDVTGCVDNADAHLKRCSVAIAPMVSCAGVQNKILKYMSLKIPTVATKIALGDLRLIPGENVIVADSNEDFVREIIAILEDEARAKKIGESGFRYVNSHHNWQKIIDKLDSVLVT